MKTFFYYSYIILGMVGSVLAIIKGFSEPNYFLQLLIYVPSIYLGWYIKKH